MEIILENTAPTDFGTHVAANDEARTQAEPYEDPGEWPTPENVRENKQLKGKAKGRGIAARPKAQSMENRVIASASSASGNVAPI